MKTRSLSDTIPKFPYPYQAAGVCFHHVQHPYRQTTVWGKATLSICEIKLKAKHFSHNHIINNTTIVFEVKKEEETNKIKSIFEDPLPLYYPFNHQVLSSL